MPPLNEAVSADEKRLRIFLYGKEKTKKTWWAAKAAEAGFNVLLINGEPGGSQILRQIATEAKSRIQVVDACDTLNLPIFSMFVAQFLKPGNVFTWDEQKKATIVGLRDTTHSFFNFNASKLTLNDVIILDSWTVLAVSASMKYAQENNIDITDGSKTEWDGYGFEGRFLDFVLNKIATLPCHVFVIGHSYTYEIWNDKKGPERKCISRNVQPISSSGRHGAKVCSKFNDVLTFSRISDVSFYIATGGDKESSGGSRLMPPMNVRWDELPPSKFFEAAGIKPTGEPCQGAVWLPPGTEQVLPKQAQKALGQVSQVTNPQSAAPVLVPGQSGLLARLAAKGG